MARTFFELHNKQNLRNFLLVGVEIEGIEGWRAWASSGSGDATEVPIPSTIIVSTNFLLVGMVVEVEGWRACTSLGVEVRGPRGEKEEKKKQKSYWSFQREIGYEGTGLRVWRYRCGRVWWYSMLNTPRFWAASSAGIWGAEKRNRIYWDVFTTVYHSHTTVCNSENMHTTVCPSEHMHTTVCHCHLRPREWSTATGTKGNHLRRR